MDKANNTELIKYFDGQLIDKRDLKLTTFMKTHGLFQNNNNSYNAAFTGIINLNQKIYIFLPKGFQAKSPESISQSGRTLLSALKKYIASGRGSKVSFSSKESDISGISPLEALDVLQDYMRFGLYNSARSEFSNRLAGKIDWNRVIKKKIPFIQNNRPPVYPEIISRKTNYFSENDVTTIHKAVLSKLDNIFGWYYSDKSLVPEFKKIKLPCDDKKAIAIVRKELSLVYSDREIRLLKNLIKILSQDGLSLGDNEHYSGITNFQNVWEDICSEIYNNDKDKFSSLIPIPAYLYGDNVKAEPANSQIMDVIIAEEEKIAILDAKYYNFAKGKPQWADLVKQFYYKRSLSAVLQDKHIENFFLAPEAESENLPEKAIIINRENDILTHEFSPINIIYLNVREAMETYLDKDNGKTYRKDLFTNYF
jgi:hypothetical protein